MRIRGVDYPARSHCRICAFEIRSEERELFVSFISGMSETLVTVPEQVLYKSSQMKTRRQAFHV